MWLKRQIPNLFTLGNLACGVTAIILLFEKGGEAAGTIAWLMFAAMAFDFADGLVARLLGVSSEIGKQLDSLCDMVTFGVLPGLLVYYMLSGGAHHFSFGNREIGFDSGTVYNSYLPYLGLLIPLFSALRLAKFNVDTRQSDKFMGLATPANAAFFLSLFLIWAKDGGQYSSLGAIGNFFFDQGGGGTADPWLYLVHPYVLIGFTALFSLLLVLDIPLIAFKFKSFSWQGNEARFLLIPVMILLLVLFTYKGIPLCIFAYFLFSGLDRLLFSKA